MLVHVHAKDEPALGELAVAEVEAVPADDALLEEGVAQAELVEQLERPRPQRARPPVDRRVGLVFLVCGRNDRLYQLNASHMQNRSARVKLTDRRGGRCSPSWRAGGR